VVKQGENGDTFAEERRGEAPRPIRLEIREPRVLNAKTAKTPSRKKAGAVAHAGPAFPTRLRDADSEIGGTAGFGNLRYHRRLPGCAA